MAARINPGAILSTFGPDKAEELLELFQKRMRLQDWSIFVYIKRRWADERSHQPAADVTFTECRRQAIIRLLDPTDYPTLCRTFPQDMLQSLIHELIHLTQRFDTKHDDDSTFEFVLAEQQANQLAEALAESYRQELEAQGRIEELEEQLETKEELVKVLREKANSK